MNHQDYDKYLQFLKRNLTSERLEHSIGVMRVMGELAEIYSLDATQAETTGLLHDAAKDLPVADQLALAEQANLQFAHASERHPVYLHAPVGAYVVATELGITDGLVLDAIRAHSNTWNVRSDDTPLARCLRSADILAPAKEWKGMNRLKSVVYAGKMEEAMLLQYHWLIELFQETDVPIHPNLTSSYQWLSDKLQVTDSFFERW